MKFRNLGDGVGLVFGSALLAFGQEQSVKLDDLVTEALRSSPEILAAQKRYEASRQRPTQESSLPEPMFSLGYQSTGSLRPFAGLGKEPMANAGFTLSQEFPFPGKLKLRGDMASKEAEAEFQQYQNAQLNVISRLKQAYYRLYYTYAAADVLNRNRESLEQAAPRDRSPVFGGEGGAAGRLQSPNPDQHPGDPVDPTGTGAE